MSSGSALIAAILYLTSMGEASSVPNVATSSAANAPSGSQSIDPACVAKAREVIALSAPRATLVETNLRGWEAGVIKALRADPAIVNLETAYPNIVDASVAAVRPLGREFAEQFVTQAIEIRVETFAERLTVDEMDQLITFYNSPAGQRFIARLWGNLDPKSLITDKALEAARTGDHMPLTIEDSKRATVETVMKTTKETSAQDVLEIMRFEQLPVAKKAFDASAEAEQRLLPIVNNPDPKWAARMREALEKAIIDFADQHGGSKAAAK